MEGLAAFYPVVFDLTDKLFVLWECSLASTPSMTFLMHWSFKTGYHEIAAKKFLATVEPFPEASPGSVGTHRALLKAGFSWRPTTLMLVTSMLRSGPSASTGRSPQCCQTRKLAPSLPRPTADLLMGAMPLDNPGGSTTRRSIPIPWSGFVVDAP